MKPLSPELLAVAQSRVEQYLAQAYQKRGPYSPGWLSIRSIEKEIGVSRSMISRLIIRVQREREAQAASALRRKFGSEPLAVGLGIAIMCPNWRVAQISEASEVA
ncbi:hypothetical protein AA0242T_2088 [Acetobacter aceti NRIC 0242]|uniref:Uncharacterized protein n=1 Tax=Acetobacter aceti NBRC 14818 TaxID=887700 RepID=A0AB33IBF2_ACEAC|nr:hypothetical protein [Acetobacter aceti]TCS32445.1 hypothetical protein EDC15_1122 [Acetobacter aceti NBRC 14818]BCK74969.1 hypothetical protein EMQ_0575 [Acetobacter aceti NBRC 14818]GAN58968.1 hypothetical protein Abac_194_003 [Acetobacter aceti NBRC 14818]GBO81386.1 hypothetical protein AA0242T_2088 [Acetobacter aceti NRIC 0242]